MHNFYIYFALIRMLLSKKPMEINVATLGDAG
jgi:hypothetical protein